jgi:hypothetical protein
MAEVQQGSASGGVDVADGRAVRLTGWHGGGEYFRFTEHDELAAAPIIDVLRGRRLGVVFRDVVAPATRAAMISRFLTSPGRRRRGADAPGEYLGAYHYAKLIDEYLDDSERVRSVLESALDVPDEPLARMRGLLHEALAAEGIDFRHARHAGRDACAGVFRSWLGQRDFALEPHDDLGQCLDPRQAGFEVQQVARNQIVAFNICLDNGTGGSLVVWNLRPDEATRDRAGVRYTGSPYAAEWLIGHERLSLDVRPGDIYLFNGAHVHAVEPVRDAAAHRVTLSGVMGFADSNTVVTWT